MAKQKKPDHSDSPPVSRNAIDAGSGQKAGELVLCMAAGDLPEKWLGTSAAVPLKAADFFAQASRVPFCWVPRSEAETQPEWKQIIPYVLVRPAGGNHLLCYRRAGSEKRLHDLWSVGIGGHINPLDQGHGAADFKGIVAGGLSREISEELGPDAGAADAVFLGVINEEATPVGRVHLGLVFLLDIDPANGLAPSDELADWQWVAPGRLRKRRLELWSELAIELFFDLN